MYHSKYNISFNIGVLSSNGIKVVSNGAALGGTSHRYYYHILFFTDWVYGKFVELPRTDFKIFKAIRDGMIDVSVNSNTLETLNKTIIDAFNASILPTYIDDICYFLHKSVRSKPKANNCIKAASDIFSIQESYFYSLCFILLLISFCVFTGDERKRQSSRNKMSEENNNISNLSKLITKRAISILLVLVPAFFIWLFGAHYTTDCAVKGESRTLKGIQELDSWPIMNIFHVLDDCGFYFNEQIVPVIGSRYRAEMAGQFESVEKIAKTEPGPLLITTTLTSEICSWYYCYDYQENCEKHYFHRTEPFAEIISVQFFGKNIGYKKIRFLLRYAYSMHENGMWISVGHKLRGFVARVVGREVVMKSGRRINSNWSPLTMSFMSISWIILLVSILFSSLVLILIEIIPFQHQNALNKNIVGCQSSSEHN